MEICKNVSLFLRAYKEASGQSNMECAQALEISCTALKNYASGRGTPCATTLEHLAQKLGVDPGFLVSGAFTDEQLILIKHLLESINFLAKVPTENHLAFAEQFLKLVLLLIPDDRDDT